MLAKLLAKLPKSPSNKGWQRRVKLLQVPPKISRRVLRVKLEAHSVNCLGIMVKAGQMQARVI